MASSRPERLRKVLVANRGEIALHVRYATEAYPIGPAPARDSYLRIDKLIDVAKKAGADAVHPGYGFLSERAEFARACSQAGLVFIGPSPEVITALGDKLTSRRTMLEHGVPVVPGSVGPVRDLAEAEKVCAEVGFPVLIK